MVCMEAPDEKLKIHELGPHCETIHCLVFKLPSQVDTQIEHLIHAAFIEFDGENLKYFQLCSAA